MAHIGIVLPYSHDVVDQCQVKQELKAENDTVRGVQAAVMQLAMHLRPSDRMVSVRAA